jgi:hypothetical protein
MTCRELAELLDDLCAGCCSAEVCHEVDCHLRQCPCCPCYVETYRLTIRWSRQLSTVALPDGLLDRVRTMLAQEASPRNDE